MTQYHVAGADYNPGEPVLCYNLLEQIGCAPAWKWEDAEPGFDGDMACVFETREDAVDFIANFGGTYLLTVEVPEDYDGYGMPSGIVGIGALHPHRIVNSEGYTAYTDGIPAEWITACEQLA